MGELEKGSQELKGFAEPQEEHNMSHPVLPELPKTKSSTRECTWSYPWLQMHRQQRMALLDIKGRRGPWS